MKTATASAPPASAQAPLWELVRLALDAVWSHRLRSLLSMIGIAIGVASVILLTSIGEGTRTYVLSQFTQFGTHLMVVSPGKSETVGLPGVLGGTTHKLTIDDAVALERLPGIESATPLAFAQARVEGGGRGRSVVIYGVTPNLTKTWQVRVRQGILWPEGDPNRGSSMAVLGPTLKQELFGDLNALGEFVRIAGRRFRVVGVMEPKGRLLGFDLGDSAYIPVASAMEVFNLEEVSEIDILYSSGVRVESLQETVTRVLRERHDGEEDFTVLTQEAMLEVFGNVMGVITMAVSAIAGISLLVGAVGILTMMWIAVGERTEEIGLVRAIGATRSQVSTLFLVEAAALALIGGLIGVLVGGGIGQGLRLLVPGLPIETPLVYVAAALAVSLLTGLLSGVLPARRAAGLDPIQALRAE